jgi:hypothetical protein
MRTDPVARQLAELDEACLELAQRLEQLRDAVAQIRRMRTAGQAISEIVTTGPGVPARREVRGSWSRLNQALHAYRVEVVRSLIDDEGMSISDAARITGNARQVVSRLYHSPRPQPGAPASRRTR